MKQRNKIKQRRKKWLRLVETDKELGYNKAGTSMADESKVLLCRLKEALLQLKITTRTGCE